MLGGSAGFQEVAVGAAVAVEGRDGGHAAAAAIGKNKVAKVEGRVGSFRRHRRSVLIS